jgi:hypothetical protein
MYQRAVSLIFSLVLLQLTSKCWAQEPTPTIDTLSITTATTTTTTLTSDSSYDGNVTETTSSSEIITEIATTSDSEIITETTATSTIETSDDSPSSITLGFPTSIPGPPELSSPDPAPSPTSAPEEPSRDFFIKISAPILRDCEAITIKWGGTNIVPLFRVSYSKGTGQLGDASILGEEIPLALSGTNELAWLVPPSSRGRYTSVLYQTKDLTFTLKFNSFTGKCHSYHGDG